MSNPYLPHWADPAVTWGSQWLWPTEAELAGPIFPQNPKPRTNPRHKHMTTDIVPQSYNNLLAWLTKQETEMTVPLATTIGATTAERDGFLAAVLVLKPKVAAIVDLTDQLEQLTADFPDIRDAQMVIIRAFIKRAKTSPGCTPAIMTLLEWLAGEQNIDPNHARPFIAIEPQRGRVKITGKKPGFDAVNLYSRRKGDVQWKLIAIRKRRFPYYDESPLAVANTPEVREYMAIGVVKDDEIGQMSEIKEVVYAG